MSSDWEHGAPTRHARVARWTLTISTVLVLVVWSVSGWGGIGFRFFRQNPGVRYTVAVGLGAVRVGRAEGFARNLGVRVFGAGEYGEFGLSNYDLMIWFDWYGRGPYRFLSVPLWILLPATAWPALSLWHRHLRWRSIARLGHCAKCSYDLSGITGVCPECGAANSTRTEMGAAGAYELRES